MYDEFIADFCGADLTPIEYVAEVTGLSLNELRSHKSYVKIDDEPDYAWLADVMMGR